MVKTEVLFLPAAIFKKCLDVYPELQTFVYTMLRYRLTADMTLIQEVIFNRLDNRLFNYLVEHSEDGMLSRTHQSIANDLEPSREVISRLLKDLQERETIRFSRNHIQNSRLSAQASARQVKNSPKCDFVTNIRK